MYKSFYIIALVFVTAAFGCGQAEDNAQAAQAGQMLHISSPAFTAGKAIPARYSCQGEEASPPLNWSGIPPETDSLALIVDDPDAPSGDWAHWVVYNLPADAGGLAENAAGKGLPEGAKTGINSWGDAAYGGVCPPSGSHRYRFKLYALDTRLRLDTPDKAALLEAMQDHILDKAELTGSYRKH